MCNLYSQTGNVKAIRRLFNVSHKDDLGVPRRW
ncbi:hypothetical protein SAMN04488557_3813 [Hyphomicrobium facile]|uniref:Uncharacterized protein n=1 Tax=Hyphomicrobium facile TaxID=51670 RepID=A0A1I7NVM8_9HYPH|nr:hypothetical protein SAMN04488557_3813 [Hyphomicrobium facile]